MSKLLTGYAVYVGLYLVAIITANLTSAAFGPSASIANAFLLIGLDLTARDRLHEAWKHKQLPLKMALLVGSGSLLSWILNRDAAGIAIASTAAFASAGLADTVIYWLLGDRAKLLRINGSNAVSGLVDSLVFPTLAFGGFLAVVSAGQWAAKLLGGYIWSWVLFRNDLPQRRSAGQPVRE